MEGHKVDRKLERFSELIEQQIEESQQKDAFFKLS